MNNQLLLILSCDINLTQPAQQMEMIAFGKEMTRKKINDSVNRSTGFMLGGVSPLGQNNLLKTIIDLSANDFDIIYVSAGRSGLAIGMRPRELKKTC